MTNTIDLPPLNYDPSTLPRETQRHYICASDDDIQAMLSEIGLNKLDELYDHIPEQVKLNDFVFPDELEYDELIEHMVQVSKKNTVYPTTFLGDGLPHYKVMSIVPYVLGLRELTTAYTPYQPERSQGTLMTHWIYQCSIAALTGFEAVNASMYDRASALFESIMTALRLKRGKKNTCIVSEGIYPGDLEVLKTMALETKLKLVIAPLKNGCTDHEALTSLTQEHQNDLACIAFAQQSHFGCLENVDELTNLAHQSESYAIAIVDPMLLGAAGLKPPVNYGDRGADMFVAEGQHLAIGPSYGGPGLGIFGIRFNSEVKNNIRSTPGRYVGQAKDIFGRECKVLVISTREQHIRREKATSNICSNQAFIATVAGASLLQRGDEGLKDANISTHSHTQKAAELFSHYENIELQYPNSPFFNQFTISINKPLTPLIHAAQKEGIQLGIDVSQRTNTNNNLLLCSFSDLQSQDDLDKLKSFLDLHFTKKEKSDTILAVPQTYLRSDAPGILKVPLDELKQYYSDLASQNVSPDSSIYPLGSCTMKYNPYINDYAASLEGFASTHPKCHDKDAQGNLEVLYQTQEYFKGMLGLPGVTTQPLAGAQGELVGIKLFQAYHRDRNDLKRDIVLIPRSAHGTNPATASMAGFETVAKRDRVSGCVLIEASDNGEIDFNHFCTLIDTYSDRIAGIMVTNPNTSGIFETRFKEIADKIHEAGGLVYMDGANMNAIAGWIDLGAMGVDAVHNNTHKTWSIPHGGGGPGDAIVGVSEKLLPFLPGIQVVVDNNGLYKSVQAEKTIGSIHRHHGNFGHKVRLYTYLRRLGREGVKKMSAVAVLSARYLYHRLSKSIPSLPEGAGNSVRMHEFILTLKKENFQALEATGLGKSDIIPRIGKLFLDFGFHAPTVAFPEVYGIMIEPTESYTKAELDRFAEAVEEIYKLALSQPEVLKTVPHFTPIDRVDDVTANRNLVLSEGLTKLPEVHRNRIPPTELENMELHDIKNTILQANQSQK